MNKNFTLSKFAAKAFVLSAICVAAAFPSPAQTVTVVKHFGGNNGASPNGLLAEGLDGNVYGTTESGGTHNNGTVFKLTPAGALNVIHNFCSAANCADGAAPLAGVTQGWDGRLYGSTWAGGVNSIGSAFAMTTKGQITTLHSFCIDSNCTDGAQPQSGLVQGSDGYFYGVALEGGANGNAGTIYRTSYVNEGYTTLYSFCSAVNCDDGMFPRGTMIQGTDGNLYGTTEVGGAYGQGAIFRFNPTTLFMETLHSFCGTTGCPDGQNPETGLVQGSDGNFYGTAFGGLINGGHGQGTVFKITIDGNFTTLHTFNVTDGSGPSTLVLGTDGNFYGTTASGGAQNKGTIFQITPAGKFKPLHSFNGGDGKEPIAGLMQKTDGAFYGTAAQGGSSNSFRTVFKLSMNLAPFVKTFPVAGKVGEGFQIVGHNLTGATSVTVDGIPANFSVASQYLIYSSVPAGANTGVVAVTTPTGTFMSNVNFQVLP